jgi:plastocyanin
MTIPTRFFVLVLSALAAALVVLPAIAGSETTPTIEAVNSGGGYYGETHAWSPATATVSAGGTVTLSNHTAVEHGVHWVSGPETPACSGIPVGTSSVTRGANWSGTCTFAKPGTYTFYCTVHGPEMTGTITVNAAGGTTVEMPSMPSTGGPTSPTGAGGGSHSGESGGGGSPLAGGTAALKLASGQHGPSVHGSIDVSAAGAGDRLEVALLASGASLAKVHRPSSVRVGRYVRTSVRAGVVPFAVSLTARGRSALRRHRRLELTVRIALTPVYGVPVTTVTHSLVLHA